MRGLNAQQLPFVSCSDLWRALKAKAKIARLESQLQRTERRVVCWAQSGGGHLVQIVGIRNGEVLFSVARGCKCGVC